MGKIIHEIRHALKDRGFHQCECHIQVVGHRIGDTLALLVAGATNAILVSLGSTSGAWIAVTTAAIADPKPVSGSTSEPGGTRQDDGLTWRVRHHTEMARCYSNPAQA